MKQILSILLLAFAVSACQSTSETSASEVPTHNPAHGQPHHDCSIAVGAPLTNQQPAPAKPAPAKETVKNPEHGKPGHRCDIPVGAPLS